MAMIISSSDEKPRSSFRSEKRPWMLKDYLRDDFSSCSSNGFRSFPRRQCCVAVRNLIELEVRTRSPKRQLSRRTSAAWKTRFSALQRASMALVNAVKLLPLKSSTSSSSSVVVDDRKQVKKSLLPRSFSRKLFRISLWKKSEEKDCTIERWASSACEKYQPLDLSTATTSTTTVWTSSRSNSNSDSKSNSWSDSEFTSDYLLSSSSENDAVEGKVDEVVNSKRVGVTAGEDSMVTAATKAKWGIEEEKQQFSPVSVLDFPDDHEDGNSSPFTGKLSHLEGRRQKLIQKLRRFECLSQLEPLNLENRIAIFGHVDDESPKLSLESSIDPSLDSTVTSSEEEKEDNGNEKQHGIEQKAEHLLQVVKAKAPSSKHKFEVDSLLLDFFDENIAQMCDKNWENSALITAEDWLSGHYDELLQGWEVKHKRQAYIRDMEKGATWRGTDAENEELTLDLAAEIIASLVDEFLAEFAV